MNISINTAHNVDIDYSPAGVFERIIATIIDSFFLFGVFIIGFFIIIPLSPSESSVMWVFIVLGVMLSLYHLIFEFFFNGKSLGKMVMRIQVVKLNGKKLTLWDCMLRWVFRLVDISLSSGAVAVISIIVTKHTQQPGRHGCRYYRNPSGEKHHAKTNESI